MEFITNCRYWSKCTRMKHCFFMFQGFYVYMYVFSIAFLVYAYAYLLQNKTLRHRRKRRNGGTATIESHVTLKRKYSFDDSRTYHTGSFYLRLGAVGNKMIQKYLLKKTKIITSFTNPNVDCTCFLFRYVNLPWNILILFYIKHFRSYKLRS